MLNRFVVFTGFLYFLSKTIFAEIKYWRSFYSRTDTYYAGVSGINFKN